MWNGLVFSCSYCYLLLFLSKVLNFVGLSFPYYSGLFCIWS
ncbi:hypothetical protein HanPI659440_Chr13g0517131 [Helianthus annuus]|nr:hypothetical protein HanPI659440_Chr13g0517131 [Helianthus annuus]